MTYSRPGNGLVSVSAGGKSGNTPDVRFKGSGSSVSRSSDTTKYDNVNPDLIYRNGMKKAEQIGKFVDFFTDTVAPAIGKELDRRANIEAGEFLQGVDPTDVTATGNQERINQFNNLNPRSQVIVRNAQGLQAAAMYPSALQANYAADSQVLTTGNSPEALEIRANAKARAKAKALKESGLSDLPPYQIAKNAEFLAQAEGRVDGALYAQRLSRESDQRRQVLVTEAGTLLSNVYNGTQQLAATTEDGRGVESRGMRGYLEGIIKTSGETEGARTQADLLLGAVVEASTNMNPADTQKMLADLKAQRNNPLYAVDGQNIWDIPIKRGDRTTTISQVLDGLEEASQVDADKYNLKQVGAQMGKLILDGDMEGAYALYASSLDLMNDPGNWTALGRLFTTESGRITPQQRKLQGDIDAAVLNGSTTYGEAVLGIFSGDRNSVSRQWLESRLPLARTDAESGAASEPPNAAALKAYATQKGSSVSEEQRNYFESKVLGLPGFSRNNKPTTKGLKGLMTAEDLKRDYFGEIWAEKETKGEPLDPVKIAEEAQSRALAELKRRQEANNTEGAATPVQQFQEFHQSVQKQLNESARSGNGKVPVPFEAISPQQKDKLQQQGISWDSLSAKQKEAELIASFVGKFEKGNNGKPLEITQQRAQQLAKEMLQGARQYGEKNPAPGIPRTVPVTEQEVYKTRSGAEVSGIDTLPGYQATVDTTLNILESVKDFLMQDKVGFGKEKDNGEAIRKWFNNDGMGDQSMRYVDGFLNLITGVQPATAAPLTHGTPDGLASLRQAWKYGSQGLKTGPLPQVPASAQARPVPTAVGNDQHELFVMIGVAEGTRTPNGGYTKAYYGHSDPGDTNYNRGTVSGGRNSSASPEMIDQKWMGILTNMQQRMRPQLIVLGLMPGTQGYNRVMFNLMDLTVQSPKAAQDFAGSLFGTVREAGFTIEAIAKARADSFINPATGRLEASGFGNNYQTLIKDQRSRAGVYDYRRRL